MLAGVKHTSLSHLSAYYGPKKVYEIESRGRWEPTSLFFMAIWCQSYKTFYSLTLKLPINTRNKRSSLFGLFFREKSFITIGIYVMKLVSSSLQIS
jgi:hypothetical protein